jgi:hypothetical protein
MALWELDEPIITDIAEARHVLPINGENCNVATADNAPKAVAHEGGAWAGAAAAGPVIERHWKALKFR